MSTTRAIEALEAEVERLTLERDVNKRMRDQHFAEVGRWKALSVTNIMLGIVPGDGSGFEVYAKSVDDVVNELTELGRKAEDAQGDNVTLRAQLAAALTAAKQAQPEQCDHGTAWDTPCRACDDEQAQPERAPLSVDAYEALVDDLGEWSRYVVEDTAHITLDTHIRRTLTVHGIKQGGQQ